MDYDFCGWVTKNDLKCADGRVIKKNAFKDNDGSIVPLVWNHDHESPFNVLGHMLLENREDGVYGYGTFNDTESGAVGKALVQHGDITSLSIYANRLKQTGSDVIHGNIREVSLVHAGANPGAYIETVVAHSDDGDEEAKIFSGIEFDNKSDEPEKVEEKEEVKDEMKDEVKDEKEEVVEHSDSEEKAETVGDVFETLTEKQKKLVYALMAAQEIAKDEAAHSDENYEDGGNESMKHNVFEKEEKNEVLSHSDQTEILTLAKSNTVGSLRTALNLYAENNEHLAHGIDDIDQLFPDYKDVPAGDPALLQRDMGWVGTVMQKVNKSPFSRIRTRQMDARNASIRAHGYQKDDLKQKSGNMTLLKRTTDPQTIYITDSISRDDYIDITDFDVVEYEYNIMKDVLNEEVALAIMIGDGREVGDEFKIYEEHIRSIWHDNDLYTIHGDVDPSDVEASLQGSEAGSYFGENFFYAEAIVTKSLYLREQYKGSGTPDFYCTPHLLNVMLLARDRNGHRMYASKSDLEKALNVNAIYTVEQFADKTRTTSDNKIKQLLGIFVNLKDYTIGHTKGGQITRFNQFDIDFNQEKFMIETRLSGALTKAYSAVVLETDITNGNG